MRLTCEVQDGEGGREAVGRALEEERLDQIAREHKIAGQLEDRLGVLFASLLCA